MCGTMGSKNQVDYVGSVFARITHLILRHFTSFLNLRIFLSSLSKNFRLNSYAFVDIDVISWKFDTRKF